MKKQMEEEMKYRKKNFVQWKRSRGRKRKKLGKEKEEKPGAVKESRKIGRKRRKEEEEGRGGSRRGRILRVSGREARGG
ncbi:hypothetical protein Pmani_031586 [Petrolisthes manimaculis]|uniref:Uncharacterized protein n=1 Tax=Petrolisthes manimaculis TaxID=1843537 RepID=A0AAE1NUE3_9EUCA|nr:hypothetical protein Pmani_031586 [Petrolisthes manimaculis]